MNVVYYSSDFFSEMCGVSIESLCERNKDSDNIVIYIIEDHIHETNKKRLRSIADRFERQLFFIYMPSQKAVYPNVKVNLGRTYARMTLGELLPDNVDRVLSLDSDTLIMDSLKDMYETNFVEHEYVAGVYDCVGKAIQKNVLNAASDLKYCNAGMYLIDLKKWRDMGVGSQLLDAVIKNAKGKSMMYFLEQDLMNEIFHGHLKLLEPRYNILTSIYFFKYKEVMKMKKPVEYYSEEDIVEAKRKPALLHATTCFYVKKRMWVEKSDHPYAGMYQEYRSRSPWGGEPKIKDGRSYKQKVYGQFWHCIPRGLAVAFAAYAIGVIRPKYAKLSNRLRFSTVANHSST